MPLTPEPHASSPSRRQVLAGAAVTGAVVAAGVTVATPAQAAPDESTAAPPGDEPVVAHVRDVRGGVIDLYVGERHVRLEDRALAARLARAAR